MGDVDTRHAVLNSRKGMRLRVIVLFFKDTFWREMV